MENYFRNNREDIWQISVKFRKQKIVIKLTLYISKFVGIENLI